MEPTLNQQFREKMLRHLEKVKATSEYKENKLRRKEYYDKLYKSTPKKMEPKELDMNSFFCFPTAYLERMTKQAKVVYPVLCSRADINDNLPFHISKQDIAKLSGVRRSSVDMAIADMERMGDVLECEKLTDRQIYTYKVDFIRNTEIDDNSGKYITFSKCLIESGLWACLTVKAKCFYLALRYKAVYDMIKHGDKMGEWIDENEIRHDFRERPFDVCKCNPGNLCKLAGIKPISITTVMNQLESFKLAGRIEDTTDAFYVTVNPAEPIKSYIIMMYKCKLTSGAL